MSELERRVELKSFSGVDCFEDKKCLVNSEK